METERTVTLSTGHEVVLPLSTDASMVGAAFGASLDGVRDLLPDGLAPVRVTPSRTAATFLCVEYDRIGRGEIDPYREFGVLFAATPGDRTATPLSAVTGELGGYVWTLPVTTEPARALGEVWDYPKLVADVAFEDDGGRRRTTVDIDGERLLSVGIERPRTLRGRIATRSYAVGGGAATENGAVVRAPLELRGDLGAAPLSDRASYALGDHALADRLRALDLGSRTLARFAFDGEFRIAAPERVVRR